MLIHPALRPPVCGVGPSALFARAALTVLLTVFCSVSAQAAAPADTAPRAFPFDLNTKVLANGLTVVAIPLDSPGIVAYYTVVRTGSRNEVERGKTGFAHFFEHMMFRGTPTYSSEAYNRILKRMGANTNAWTWDDQTVYYNIASASSLPKLVEIEADRFQNLSYKSAEFQKEARAVLGEYNKASSNPKAKLREVLRNLAFDKHTYKHTTMGFLKDIEAMPKQFAYSKKFFDRYYRPDNCAVIVAGDVDPAALFAMAQTHYGPWKKGPARPKVRVEPVQKREKRKAIVWPGKTVPRLSMAYKVPGFDPKTQAAFDVLKEVVFAKRGALYGGLVLKSQRVQDLSAAAYHKVDTALFTVSAAVPDPANLAAVEQEIQAALDTVARDGVPAKTLAETTSHMRYAFAAELGTARGVASNAAWYWSLRGDLGVINTHWAAVASVTSDDLKRVAAKYFTVANRTVVTMTSKAKGVSK